MSVRVHGAFNGATETARHVDESDRYVTGTLIRYSLLWTERCVMFLFIDSTKVSRACCVYEPSPFNAQ